jgi:pyrroloquinoline quinone biosynthesis protein B
VNTPVYAVTRVRPCAVPFSAIVAPMLVRVLGSAAEGGVPRWDCACPGCTAVRRHEVRGRTHASLAVSADGERWLLVEASPDVLRQLHSFDSLHPRSDGASPLAAALLLSGRAQSSAGLPSLASSEVRGRPVYAPRSAIADISRDARTSEGAFAWTPLETDEPVELRGLDGELGLTATLLAPGGRAGLAIREPSAGKLVMYLPDIPEGVDLRALVDGADAVFLDASRVDPDLELRARHRVATSVHHASPLADERSAAWKALRRSAWTLAHDGLDLFV